MLNKKRSPKATVSYPTIYGGTINEKIYSLNHPSSEGIHRALKTVDKRSIESTTQ